MESQSISSAVIHILHQLVYFLFVMPYHLWCNAINRLATQRENESLKITEIKSQWPMFTFLKRWFIDFLFDMFIAIVWIAAIIFFFITEPWEAGFFAIITFLYISYFSVVLISCVRDLFILLLKPFSKFLNWLSKPAQHLDLTIDKELL